MKQAGLPSSALGTARSYFILAAYQAFDGERAADAVNARILLASLSFLLTRSPIMYVAQTDKRFYAERYAILGEHFELGHEYATKEHNKTLARLARSYLKDDLLVDPTSLPIDTISCAILPFPGLTCAKDLERQRKIFR